MTRNLGLPKLGWVWIVVLAEAALLAIDLQTPAEPARAAPPVMATPASAVSGRVSLQPVLDFHPFGAVPVVAEPPPAAPVEPEPMVQPRGLALQGVLLPGSGPARALVSMDDGPALAYVKGDPLPGGGILADIAADQIWIDRDGEKQPLGFVAPPPAAQVAEDPVPTEAEADLAEDPPAKPVLKAKSLPQPDLRHLIPDLTKTAAVQP